MSLTLMRATPVTTTFIRRPFVDVHQFAYAIRAINNLSTIVAVVCVFPTHFLHLRPATYRLILFLGILCGLSTLAIAITTTFFDPAPGQWSRDAALFPVVVFSPLVVVLIAILARIKRVTRVGLWSTVVLFCVILDWAGISGLLLVLE
jgi:hypothetical protein